MKRASTASLIVLLSTMVVACGAGKSVATHTQTAPATTPSPTASNAAPPPSRELAGGVVEVSSGSISATMRASSHHPRVNRPWPVSFEVSTSGKPATAQVRYEYLFAGQVVAHRSDYHFTGRFHDTFLWPSSALGYLLTFRAVILAAGRTLYLDYPVQVQS